MADPTADQLLRGVTAAMKERDFPAVVVLLERLAVVDPQLASDAYDTIKLGLAVAQGIAGAEP